MFQPSVILLGCLSLAAAEYYQAAANTGNRGFNFGFPGSMFRNFGGVNANAGRAGNAVANTGMNGAYANAGRGVGAVANAGTNGAYANAGRNGGAVANAGTNGGYNYGYQYQGQPYNYQYRYNYPGNYNNYYRGYYNQGSNNNYQGQYQGNYNGAYAANGAAAANGAGAAAAAGVGDDGRGYYNQGYNNNYQGQYGGNYNGAYAANGDAEGAAAAAVAGGGQANAAGGAAGNAGRLEGNSGSGKVIREFQVPIKGKTAKIKLQFPEGEYSDYNYQVIMKEIWRYIYYYGYMMDSGNGGMNGEREFTIPSNGGNKKIKVTIYVEGDGDTEGNGGHPFTFKPPTVILPPAVTDPGETTIETTPPMVETTAGRTVSPSTTSGTTVASTASSTVASTASPTSTASSTVASTTDGTTIGTTPSMKTTTAGTTLSPSTTPEPTTASTTAATADENNEEGGSDGGQGYFNPYANGDSGKFGEGNNQYFTAYQKEDDGSVKEIKIPYALFDGSAQQPNGGDGSGYYIIIIERGSNGTEKRVTLPPSALSDAFEKASAGGTTDIGDKGFYYLYLPQKDGSYKRVRFPVSVLEQFLSQGDAINVPTTPAVPPPEPGNSQYFITYQRGSDGSFREIKIPYALFNGNGGDQSGGGAGGGYYIIIITRGADGSEKRVTVSPSALNAAIAKASAGGNAQQQGFYYVYLPQQDGTYQKIQVPVSQMNQIFSRISSYYNNEPVTEAVPVADPGYYIAYQRQPDGSVKSFTIPY